MGLPCPKRGDSYTTSTLRRLERGVIAIAVIYRYPIRELDDPHFQASYMVVLTPPPNVVLPVFKAYVGVILSNIAYGWPNRRVLAATKSGGVHNLLRGKQEAKSGAGTVPHI